MDQRQPLTPSSLSPVAPTLVRHEMAVSPIRVSSRSQAVSTRTPEPVSKPKSTLVDVSTQGNQMIYSIKDRFHPLPFV